MTDRRRAVRATAGFFDDLDRQLPSERGPNGEPSTNDFQVFELLRVVEQFAVGFDDLPELIPGRPEYRILVADVAPASGASQHDRHRPSRRSAAVRDLVPPLMQLEATVVAAPQKVSLSTDRFPRWAEIRCWWW